MSPMQNRRKTPWFGLGHLLVFLTEESKRGRKTDTQTHRRADTHSRTHAHTHLGGLCWKHINLSSGPVRVSCVMEIGNSDRDHWLQVFWQWNGFVVPVGWQFERGVLWTYSTSRWIPRRADYASWAVSSKLSGESNPHQTYQPVAVFIINIWTNVMISVAEQDIFICPRKCAFIIQIGKNSLSSEIKWNIGWCGFPINHPWNQNFDQEESKSLKPFEAQFQPLKDLKHKA